MRLLLIGQAPSRHGDPTHPLEGRIGLALCKLFGCSFHEYLQETERINVLMSWPGKNGKGDAFPRAEASLSAKSLMRALAYRRIMFVGVATGRAFKFRGKPLQWVRRAGGIEAAVVPHPSGINRWWNSKTNKDRAARFLRRAWRTQGDSR